MCACACGLWCDAPEVLLVATSAYSCVHAHVDCGVKWSFVNLTGSALPPSFLITGAARSSICCKKMTDICDETAMWRDDATVKAAATAKAAPSSGGEVETLWETMAEELVSLIACYLSPIAPGSPSLSSSPGYHPAAWLACPPLSLPAAKTHWAESSVGAAHWVQLSRALRAAVPTWCASHCPECPCAP